MIRNYVLMRTASVLVILILAFLSTEACGPKKVTNEIEKTSGGNVSYRASKVDGEVISELRRVFQNQTVAGEGIFENDNEGLARRQATQLAVAELAGKVQTTVKGNSVIYNNRDVRDVVETNINAIVKNYNMDFSGYDPGTQKYRVKVSITGETLIREIQSQIK